MRAKDTAKDRLNLLVARIESVIQAFGESIAKQVAAAMGPLEEEIERLRAVEAKYIAIRSALVENLSMNPAEPEQRIIIDSDGGTSRKKPGRPKAKASSPKKKARKMSAEGKANIRAALQRRWAEWRAKKEKEKGAK